MIIGITGQIGSGKTEVAGIFKKFGATVISADKIGKEVVNNNSNILRRLVKVFGPTIISKSGRLRRRRLGEMAFSSEKNKRRLNSIIHPSLLKELARRTRQAVKNNTLVVVDAALLIDWGWQNKVDYTILVHADEKVRVGRLKKTGYTETESRLRIKSQIPFSAQKRFADYIIINNKSLDSLVMKVEKIIAKLASKGVDFDR